MLTKLIRSATSFLNTVSSSFMEFISTEENQKRKIRDALYKHTDRKSAETISAYLCGETDTHLIDPNLKYRSIGKVLLNQLFSYKDKEMIRFYQMLIDNKQERLIYPLIVPHNSLSNAEIQEMLQAVSATSLSPCDTVKLFIDMIAFKQYKELLPHFAFFLLPENEDEVTSRMEKSGDDAERFIWVSILLKSENDRLPSIKNQLESLTFEQNSNYTLSLLNEHEFTKQVITRRIAEWLDSKGLDKTGKLLTMLESGDFTTPLSTNLTKKLSAEFYPLFIKGLKLNHQQSFIKNLVHIGSTIDRERTLSKLSSVSIIKYVKQEHIPLQTAVSFFISKGKEKHLETLIQEYMDLILEQTNESEEFLAETIPYLWNFDPEKCFPHFMRLLPTVSDSTRDLLIKRLKGYEDGFDEYKEMLNSRRVILRSSAITLLLSFDKDEVSELLKERLEAEKNAAVKAELTEALKEPEDEDDTPAASRVVELIMVTTNNNNKYYRMKDNGDSFSVEWGRVGGRSQSATYAISEWNKKYNEKIRKGYVDNTKLFLKKKAAVEYKDIDDKVVQRLINDLMDYSNKTIHDNYTVTAENVTRQQIDKAQEIIDDLASRIKIRTNVTKLNESLIELYQVIPRKMNNVNDHLYNKTGVGKDDLHELERLISSEQDKLDAMSSKLRLLELEDDQDSDVEERTILEAMGLKIRVVDRQEEKKIKGMMRSISGKYKRAYAVENVVTQQRFDKHMATAKHKNTELYFHGSRNENFLNILQTGLLIRPSGAIYTGSMFGDGIYFADKAIKSLGYTSLQGSYWASGSSNRGFMAIFNVHMGKAFEIKKHSSWCTTISEKVLQQKGGYDSVFAKGGADLRNNEMIVYTSKQCTINYLIDLG